ncbi:MAG: helix-turn-helix domain-containing protein [Microthrixaceae bacterium]
METGPDDYPSFDTRGILYPARLPTFHRQAAPGEVAHLIRWFWIPRWELAPGRVSRQEVLAFPASNLVVGTDRISLSGPTTRVSHRDLKGAGWAVGALLRPAGLCALGVDPNKIVDSEIDIDAPELASLIHIAMSHSDHDKGRSNAVDCYVCWIVGNLSRPSDASIFANEMEDLIATDRTIVRVDQAAEALGISVRSLQRLARQFVGVSPLAIIRRYRLQEAAERLREDPSVTIAQISSDLAYSDQAHLSADFRTVLGMAPGAYRLER